MNPARRFDGWSTRWLLAGGIGSGIASLLQFGIIAGGPDWYRFFGAGERMAAAGSPYPAIITAGIATILAVWTLYALSGAGVIRPLPLLRVALVLIAAVYLVRGTFGIPAVFLVDEAYMSQLRARMTFMVVSSVMCVFLGLCYAPGAVGVAKLEQGSAE